jgi:hypothetical protein
MSCSDAEDCTKPSQYKLLMCRRQLQLRLPTRHILEGNSRVPAALRRRERPKPLAAVVLAWPRKPAHARGATRQRCGREQPRIGSLSITRCRGPAARRWWTPASHGPRILRPAPGATALIALTSAIGALAARVAAPGSTGDRSILPASPQRLKARCASPHRPAAPATTYLLWLGMGWYAQGLYSKGATGGLSGLSALARCDLVLWSSTFITCAPVPLPIAKSFTQGSRGSAARRGCRSRPFLTSEAGEASQPTAAVSPASPAVTVSQRPGR